MDTIEKTGQLGIREKISTLWIVVMFSMAFADIVGFMTPGALEEIMDQSAAPFPITQEIMLVFSVLIAIPILMIYLSRVLKYQVNRIANRSGNRIFYTIPKIIVARKTARILRRTNHFH